MGSWALLLCCLWYLTTVRAAVTVYSQKPLGQTLASTETAGAPAAEYTGLKAYDPLTLNPPPLPDPRPATQFALQLQSAAGNVPGLSIPVSGALLGLSVETSVINHFLGVNSSFIQVPFLNLISTVIERAGRFHIRVGGNTQETARLVENTVDGRMIEKQNIDPNKPTATPVLVYTMELFYLLGNISSLANVKWYLGVPFKDLEEIHLEIAEHGQRVLGDNLLGIQVGNEPDLYERHSARPAPYGPEDYCNEFDKVLQAMQANPNIPITNNLIGPSVSSGGWSPELVYDAGFVSRFQDNLYAITVENYPSDNCFAIYGGNGRPHDVQAEFVNYLTHDGQYSGRHMLDKFLNSAAIAQASGKPMIMFETNTASCGGFPGASNSFGAALWAVDYGMQLAFSNFTHGLLHVGGQDTYYNPATPPPTGVSTFYQWTVNPIMYSIVVVAEALGNSNTSQVVDLWPNSGDVHTPGYAVYESGNLVRVLLMNYMTDPSGASDYTASISVGGGETGTPNAVPAEVKVKYLWSPSVSDHFNITWAGQTFGGQFESDGRLKGEERIETIACDQAANICPIKVPAPGVALVFFSDAALQEVTPTSTLTYATTAVTRTLNTATVDVDVLATSNGQSGRDRALMGSTSKGSTGAAFSSYVAPSLTVLIAMLAPALAFMKVFSR